jgi:hypothetical protein
VTAGSLILSPARFVDEGQTLVARFSTEQAHGDSKNSLGSTLSLYSSSREASTSLQKINRRKVASTWWRTSSQVKRTRLLFGAVALNTRHWEEVCRRF